MFFSSGLHQKGGFQDYNFEIFFFLSPSHIFIKMNFTTWGRGEYNIYFQLEDV